MAKPRLMTPGPTEVPERTLGALSRQVRHHRTREFRTLLGEVLEGLKYVFRTENDVLLLSSSGTGAMEAAVVNVVPRGGKAIVLDSGKFSRRWRKICEAYAIQVVRHDVPWGETFDADDVARLLREHADAVAVYTTLVETSTGVVHDVEAIGRVVGATDALLVVDAISGAGAVPCYTDAWGIDVLVVGVQKALMTPPGLAMLAVSRNAWRQIESIEPQAFYFDLSAYRRDLIAPDTPYTPAIPLVGALAESLRAIREEGIEAVWTRARVMAEATRAGVAALGLKLVATRPADALTAVYFPPEVDGRAFLPRLQARFGVRLAGGQGPLAGKIFRIAHMGVIDELDILSTIAALELVLAETAHPVELGSGVAAASRAFSEASAQQGPNGVQGATFQ